MNFCMIKAWFLLISLVKFFELPKSEICSIYPGVDLNPAENMNGSSWLLEFLKRGHLSKNTIASDMKLVPNKRATLVLHFGVRFDSPANNIFKVVHL